MTFESVILRISESIRDRTIIAVLLISCTLSACAPPSEQIHPVGAVKPAAPNLPPPPMVSSIAGKSRDSDQSCRIPVLVELWQQRADAPITDLPIGPGDIIDVSVPEIEELQNQKVRVSAQGEIELPLIGSVEAAGLGESELHDSLVKKLTVYMKNPRVELFVENYRSRGVAIMGAVQKPGYYDLADERESVEGMLGLAGGLSAGASQKIIFSPAISRSTASAPSNSDNHNLVATKPLTNVAARQALEIPSVDGEPSALPGSLADGSIVVDLDSGADAACLNLPARPGDSVIVPVAGQVMVEGWVQNPGAFTITPGLTVLGAVTAAGGPVFSWWAELIRTNETGGKTITQYTLSHLESGQENDPPVQSGDVVLVEKTLVGAVPYAFYSIFQHFGTGIALPIF
jgi:polysaccharide export outer membrane protein